MMNMLILLEILILLCICTLRLNTLITMQILGTLWQFKRDEQNMNGDGNSVDVTAGSTSFR